MAFCQRDDKDGNRKTAELDLIYQEIYAKGILKYEIESFTDEGECEILYYR